MFPRYPRRDPRPRRNSVGAPPPYGGPFAGAPTRLPPPHAHAPYYYGGPAAGFGDFGNPAPMPVQVQLQSVAAANYAAQLDVIGALLPRYPYVVVDTEYPGTVHRPPAGRRDGDGDGDGDGDLISPDERYALVKANVDELPVVQLGITLCDAHGNLPYVSDYSYHGYYRGSAECAWEVGFSDFDVRRDRHAAQSVAFLRSQGVDFDAARAHGVSSAAFGAKLAEILASAPRGNVELTWVAFGGAYDIAYLVKMLDGGKPLPETRQAFMERVRELLGGRVFDAKFMAENCGRTDLRGVGLRSVAANLGAAMAAGDLPWLAGTKSVTAYRVHTILRLHVLSRDDVAGFEGVIDGLQ